MSRSGVALLSVFRPLLPASERRADSQLREIADVNGWRVFPHVKLSDVIDKKPTDIDHPTWNYATRAHFDFVVVDEKTVPIFAVEIDGLSHCETKAIVGDRMKDRLVEAAGFELLRVGADNLSSGPRGRHLIEYLIDARQYLEAAWESECAQTDPYFDPDYTRIVEFGPDGHLTFVNHLSEPARRKALAQYEKGRIPEPVIRTTDFTWDSGWTEAWAWLKVGDALSLFEKAQVRDFGRFRCGLAPFQIAEDLAADAIGDALDAFLSGDARAVRPERMQRDLEAVLSQRTRLSDCHRLDHCNFAPRRSS